MQETITYNVAEFQKLKQEVYGKLESMQRALGVLRHNVAVLEKIEKLNDDGCQEWKISISSKLIRELKGVTIILPDEHSGQLNIRWKSVILATIKKHDMPMNSSLLYEKIRQEYPDYEKGRRFMIKNISSALNGLYNETRLFRHLFKGRNDYLYGLSKFYDDLGKVKEEYFSKFKREYEGTL